MASALVDNVDMTMQKHLLVNAPEPHESDLPFTAPPTPKNPVVRGLLLYILSHLVTGFAFVQKLLWSNAGFATLRDRRELKDIAPRYDPTVIRTTLPSERGGDNEKDYLATLASENWKSKRPFPTSSQPLLFASVLDYHEAYLAQRITPVDVIDTLLPLIRRDISPRSAHSTIFLSTRVDLVRAAAQASAARYAAGKPLGPLDGVPVAVKDEVDLSGYPRTLGSKVDFSRSDDATSFCVAAWLAAGAVCIGKTSMHELGSDTTNCNPTYGTPRNPYHAGYFTGGSSGGSAAAVASGLVPFAMGNDGGGSVRIPAAYCGLFGLKTSASRVSSRPSVNLAKSTGVPGPLAANMCDLEMAYRVMSRPDPENSVSSLFAAPGPVSLDPTDGKQRILGICTPWLSRADPEVRQLCDKLIDHLTSPEGGNYKTVEVHMPMILEGQLAHAMTILSELSSGISPRILSKLTPPTQVLLSTARQTTAIDFLQAQKVRSLLMSHLAALYEKHPDMLLITPTTPNAGWKSASPSDFQEGSYGFSDANTQLRNMEYVWLANFVGCPAISAPVGFLINSSSPSPSSAEKRKKKGTKPETETDSSETQQKVPVGIMAMASWGNENLCLRFGYDVEKWLGQGHDDHHPSATTTTTTSSSSASSSSAKQREGLLLRTRPAVWVDVLGRTAAAAAAARLKE